MKSAIAIVVSCALLLLFAAERPEKWAEKIELHFALHPQGGGEAEKGLPLTAAVCDGSRGCEGG